MRRIVLPVCLAFSVLVAPACSGDDSPITEPTPITTTTETFTGTLTVNGAQTHSFPTDGGNVIATVTALAPDPLSVISVSLGTWNGTACQIVIADDNATQGSIVIGTASQSGNLCLRLLDPGRLTASVSYTVQVVHP